MSKTHAGSARERLIAIQMRGRQQGYNAGDYADALLSTFPALRYLLEPVEGVQFAQRIVKEHEAVAEGCRRADINVPPPSASLTLARQVLTLAAENAAMKEKIGGEL